VLLFFFLQLIAVYVMSETCPRVTVASAGMTVSMTPVLPYSTYYTIDPTWIEHGVANRFKVTYLGPI
jgi:hypothetical protein